MTKKRLAAVLITAAALLSALAVAVTNTFEDAPVEPIKPIVGRFEHPWPIGTQVYGVYDTNQVIVAEVVYVGADWYIMQISNGGTWKYTFDDVDKLNADVIQQGGGLVLLMLRAGDSTRVLYEAVY